MIGVQKTKRVVILKPQIKNNGAFAGNTYFDTSGWGHARVEFLVGDTDVIIGSTDTSTAPFVEECDTAGGSYTAVTGAALSAVISATDDNKNFAIDVNLAKTHKRYMRVNAPTAGDATGGNLCIIATLSEPARAPKDGAGQGFEELVSA